MSISDDQIAHVYDLFSEIPGLSIRKMFGGLAIYSEGTIFALIGPEDALMIKARDDLADELQALGCTQFTYMGKKAPTHMPYWTLPDAAQDDPAEAAHWARKSLAQNA